MTILIVIATGGELAPVAAELRAHPKHRIDIVTTGVGMVPAAAWCSRALTQRQYDLALNFGVLSRLTWLNNEGKEGLVGFETGVMGMGLATDRDRQLAIVAGFGVSIPLGNANQPTQAAVNIHAWAAYSIGVRHAQLRDAAGQPTGTIELNPWAFIFGPSITIGSVGAFL